MNGGGGWDVGLGGKDAIGCCGTILLLLLIAGLIIIWIIQVSPGWQ